MGKIIQVGDEIVWTSRYGDVRWEGSLRPSGPDGRYYFDNNPKTFRNPCSVYKLRMVQNGTSPVAVIKMSDSTWNVELYGDVIGNFPHKSAAQQACCQMLGVYE